NIIEPAISKHAGRLFKAVGDGFLVEFASAVQAVEAARAIQQANAEGELRLRIGIHVGDVVVQGDDLMGDGVNIAARVEGTADAGGIAISRAVHEQVRDKLDVGFEDRGEIALKNLARPVHVFSIAGSKPTVATAPALALPDRPSIAVLPFQNMSGDPEQEYFADGVSEDIITELARFHELFVIARNSSFTYKGRSIDVRNVAAELGVRYVLEGSIRRVAQRIRVTGQLIDAATGNHIWAERYDRLLEDVFAVQEELTQSIVGAIAPHIRDAEAAQVRRRPESVGAYEFAVRANAKAWEAYAKADQILRDEAITDARSALAIDPGSTIALNAIALAQCQHIVLGTAPDRQAAWQDGISAATRAINADRNGNVGHTWKGVLLSFAVEDKYRNEALGHARRGRELNPHDSLSLMMLAFVEINEGDVDSEFRHLEQALRISPRDPLRHFMFHQLSRACFITRQYAEGEAHALAAIREAPDLPLSYATLIGNRIGLGNIEGGRAVLAEVLRLDPDLLQRNLQALIGGFRVVEHRRRYDTFLRVAAGLEDPSVAEALR
ncbi:MAG TPA: adenylate/guanylate cyclase domain-containing protein, partial [Burkholderiales bacterium]|nr:adenylate/guanylate cyclase domain-containing protein [Burkholderiales bacterium]